MKCNNFLDSVPLLTNWPTAWYINISVSGSNQEDTKKKFCLLIFLNQLYMFQATNLPILTSTFWLYIQLLVQCTDIVADRCIVPIAVYTVKKCSWGWASLSPETCRADLKISIKGTCSILLVAYNVILSRLCGLPACEQSDGQKPSNVTTAELRNITGESWTGYKILLHNTAWWT